MYASGAILQLLTFKLNSEPSYSKSLNRNIAHEINTGEMFGKAALQA